LFYQGRLSVACEFEEFSADIALNRLVRAACDRVAASALLPRELRQRARAGLARMTDVGLLQDADFRANVDRLTHRYADTIAFAKVLLRGGGIRIAHGAAHGWCFLIRTPELVEAGIRAVLQRALSSRYTVRKTGRALSGSFTLNPDLVFDGGLAVGDVKYKDIDPDWSRSDLYQVIAFAAGFDCDCAMIVGFSDGSTAGPTGIRFGKIGVGAFAWDVSPFSEPEASGKVLAAQIAAFIARAGR
jgi:5-methylcytosine-specific restriction enzyme subunit McrC